MKLNVIMQDISVHRADAIVLPANNRLLPGGGLSGVLHSAAGDGLAAECEEVYTKWLATGNLSRFVNYPGKPLKNWEVYYPTEPGKITPGSVAVTKAYSLPSKYVIHAVGPVYIKEFESQCRSELVSCYVGISKLCKVLELKTVAIPAISCGLYGFPWKDAAELAVKTSNSYFSATTKVTFCVNNAEYFNRYTELINNLKW